MKKYVLTGGPSIGKTTAIEILASMGYSVAPEIARMVIEEERIKDSDVLPWKDLKKFQEKVAGKQVEMEDSILADVVFLDRSVIDGYGYSKLGNIAPPILIEKVAKGRYEKIFVLDPLPHFENDGLRFENHEEAKIIHQAIIDAYKHFGYDPIFVPVLPPQERVEYILDRIDTK
jgi:predicted ATPase